ncbi:hypothetical protein BO83DRAFT_121079 [Aspergillus eucalypticola CBS 122712]|uniref:Uncharacterized protein n=1 Tax=Aspergillus eucalypticola (strain CBS 122712 / IBT 29274) TaxID=1448314 RepID=A0A317UWX0_ASPEC|nr:uncharacterized protein BO83DRAFT_121079 [Aspergillus eucalypticola CBS 122712]PWY65528.1 hypothetical protein BO83DRAFT_121079 [Aspergillus eucalypticola CBS 122712]
MKRWRVGWPVTAFRASRARGAAATATASQSDFPLALSSSPSIVSSTTSSPLADPTTGFMLNRPTVTQQIQLGRAR